MYWKGFSFAWFLEFQIYPDGIRSTFRLVDKSIPRILGTVYDCASGDIFAGFSPILYRVVLPFDWLFVFEWILPQAW